MTDDFLFETTARFRISDIFTLYEALAELADQVSPEAANTLIRVHDRLGDVGVAYCSGFSVQFPDTGTRFTRGWQSETVESKWQTDQDKTRGTKGTNQ